jgi:ribosomal protein S12 methylthiotransferase accessory factor
MPRFVPFLYKDAAPLETIERIRSILASHRLLVTETAWYQHGSFLHSVRISSPDGLLAANGKGLTREAALASAYAELMERLQNRMLHRFDYYLCAEHARWRGRSGFQHAPDEVRLPVSEYVDRVGVDLLRRLAPADAPADVRDWLDRFSEDGSLLCVPFEEIETREPTLLPLRLLRFVYASTGMCAGNTADEALVQGLSEVVERHVLDVVYHDGVVPPELPAPAYATAAILPAIIADLRERTGLVVSVRDCSLGIGLPAAAVVLYDRERAHHAVSFGAHPNLDEAIARCLTEGFQGVEPGALPPGTPTNLRRSGHDPRPGSRNFKLLRHCGRGAHSNAFLYGDPGYPAELTIGPLRLKVAGARAAVIEALGRLSDAPILVRDVSTLGFPAFQTVVPGVAGRRYLLQEVDQHLRLLEVAGLLVDLDRGTPAGLRRVRDLVAGIVRDGTLYESSLAELTWLPLGPSSPWRFTPPELLLFLLDMGLGDVDPALAWLDACIDRLTGDDNESEARALAATRDLLVLTARDGLPEASAREVLRRFHPPDAVREAEALRGTLSGEPARRRQGGVIFGLEVLGMPACPRCDACPLREGCELPAWERIDDALRGAAR